MAKNHFINKIGITLPSLLFLGLTLTARILSTPTANVSFLLLASYALLGRVQAIQALLLSWLFTMFSPGLAAEATGSAVGRYAVLLCAALSVSLRSNTFHKGIRLQSITMGTLLLGAFFIVHALLFSPMLDVSVLKALSWTIAMSTLIAAWSKLNVTERARLEQQVFGILTLVLLVSLPLLMLPIGYLRNGTGFQGILNHPQAFGMTMALLSAWVASRILGERRPTWPMLALMIVSLGLVLLSEARTAGVALVLGVGFAALITPRLAGKSSKEMLPGLRSKRFILVAGLTLIGLSFSADKVVHGVSHYISKGGRAEATTLLAAYEGSRGKLMDEMWLNIHMHPLTGIGFGIASNPEEMMIVRDPVLGLPISASIEKGVLPLAVWEELGIIGLIAFCFWVLLLLKRSARAGVTPVAVGLTVLFLNMGESTLFSPGGMGLLLLVLVGWASSSRKNSVQEYERGNG